MTQIKQTFTEDRSSSFSYVEFIFFTKCAWLSCNDIYSLLISHLWYLKIKLKSFCTCLPSLYYGFVFPEYFWYFNTIIQNFVDEFLPSRLFYCDNYTNQKLTHFSPVSHFYTPWKRKGFLTFSGSIEMWHWTKMG